MKKPSPLHNWHQDHGAEFVDWGECSVPQSYGRVDLEYAALKEGCGAVDQCHQARIRIEANDLIGFLNAVLTADVGELKPGTCTYAFLCNDRGGIVDSYLVYLDKAFALLLGSSAGRLSGVESLRAQADKLPAMGAKIIDVTDAQGLVSLRGPLSLQAIRTIAFDQDVSMEPGEGRLVTVGSAKALIIRPEGDLIEGFDIVSGSLSMFSLWEKIIDAGRVIPVTPVGQKAYECLRIRAGVPRVGVDCGPDTTPLEINQSPRVDFQKSQFPGRRAMMHSTSSEFSRVLVSLRMDGPGETSEGGEILADQMPVGRLTSSALVPGEGHMGLGYVNSLKSSIGTRLTIRTKAGDNIPAQVVKPAFQRSTF